MTRSQNIKIAKISSAHGIKGYVKLFSYSDNITKYNNKIFDDRNILYDITIISKLEGKYDNLFIAKISNITDRNQAKLLTNTDLFIKREDLEETADDEFYLVDLLDLDVIDMQNNHLGKVVDVNDFGAGIILEIKFNDSKIESFSFTDQIFPKINIKQNYLIIDPPQFLIFENKSNEQK